MNDITEKEEEEGKTGTEGGTEMDDGGRTGAEEGAEVDEEKAAELRQLRLNPTPTLA